MQLFCKVAVIIAMTLTLATAFNQLAAQVPIVPAEMMAGHQRLNFQATVTRRFTEGGKTGFFVLASFAAGYKNQPTENELAVPVQVNYTFWKGLGLMSGVSMNARAGFHPIAGPQFVMAREKILVVFVPGIFLTGDHNAEVFSLVEFKPALTQRHFLYTRFQSLLNYNLGKDVHARSYVNLRFGIRFNKLCLGLGANHDWYGPARLTKSNYGVFARWNFSG